MNEFTIHLHIHHHDAKASEEMHDKLDTIISQGVKMAGELQRLTAAVTLIKGKADSLIALVNGLAQLIRDNMGNPAALADLAGQLEAEAASVQAAIDANPLPADAPVTVALPGATLGTAYDATLSVTGATAAIVQSGSLPDGLSLVGLAISGTPLRVGDFSFIVLCVDGNGLSVGVATTYTISVT